MDISQTTGANRPRANTVENSLTPDPQQTRQAAHLLLTGVTCGLLMYWLVWDRTGGGLGMLIWTLVCCASVLWLNRHQGATWRRELWCWIAVMCTAATLAVLRDALVIMALMYLVMLLCLGLVFFRARGLTLAGATLPQVALTALRLPARILLSFFPALDTVIKEKWQGGSQLGSILRGLLLATPLVLVFVLLFSSADAVFNQQLQRIATWMGELTPSTPLVMLLLTVVVTGLLSCSLVQDDAQAQGLTGGQGLWPGLQLSLCRTETLIIMGSLALLFIAFVVLQTSYLFGGRELIESRSGLTLAGYARRGFFELLAVAALTLAVLMALASAQCYRPVFRRLGAVLIVCVLIMLLSAWHRLHLYIEQFGLTLARLVALTAMLWLATGLLWFAATVLRDNIRGFLAGVVITGMACFIVLAAMNPLAFVAGVNLNHARTHDTALDIGYLARLGADAAPVIVPALDCSATRYYFGHWAELNTAALLPQATQQGDWRDWNASRAAAREIVTRQLASC